MKPATTSPVPGSQGEDITQGYDDNAPSRSLKETTATTLPDPQGGGNDDYDGDDDATRSLKVKVTTPPATGC
jgi:hypothetical protein